MTLASPMDKGTNSVVTQDCLSTKHSQSQQGAKMINVVGFNSTFMAEIAESLDRNSVDFGLISAKEPFPSNSYTWPESLSGQHQIILGHASPEERLEVAKSLTNSKDLTLATVVDSSAVVASSASLGHGSYVNSLAAIGAHATVGCSTFVNRSASIGHHSQISSFVFVGPGATLCSEVSVGFGAVIGAGSVIKDQVSIGRQAIIGAGAVVLRDVADFEVLVGNPARVIKQNSTQLAWDECPWCNN